MPQKIENKRKIPRQSRSKAMYNDILDATVRVLYEEGFARTTTTRIADKAGISAGSLYQYFANKEHIFQALLERQFNQLDERLASISDGHAETDLDGSIGLLTDAVLEPNSHFDLLAEIHDQQYDIPRHPVEEKARRIFPHIEGVLMRHSYKLRDGVNHKDSAYILMSLLEGAIRAVHRPEPDQLNVGEVTREMKLLLRSYLSTIQR